MTTKKKQATKAAPKTSTKAVEASEVQAAEASQAETLKEETQKVEAPKVDTNTEKETEVKVPKKRGPKPKKVPLNMSTEDKAALAKFLADGDGSEPQNRRARALLNFAEGNTKLYSVVHVGSGRTMLFDDPLTQSVLDRLIGAWPKQGMQCIIGNQSGGNGGTRKSAITPEVATHIESLLMQTPPDRKNRKGVMSTPNAWTHEALALALNDSGKYKKSFSSAQVRGYLVKECEQQTHERIQVIKHKAEQMALNNGYSLGKFKAHENLSNVWTATCEETSAWIAVIYPTCNVNPREIWGPCTAPLQTPEVATTEDSE